MSLILKRAFTNFLKTYYWHWSWNANTVATWCEEPTHWKRPWCWERVRAGGEGNHRGWDGWMASPTQWTWVWVNSGRWWRTGKPGMLQSMGWQSRTQQLNKSWVLNVFVWVSTLPKRCSEVFNFQLLFMSPPSAKLMTLESLLISTKELLYQSQNISYSLHIKEVHFSNPRISALRILMLSRRYFHSPKFSFTPFDYFTFVSPPTPTARWLVT